jgi:alginate O-acetyltransferase complex protein AlgJ
MSTLTDRKTTRAPLTRLSQPRQKTSVECAPDDLNRGILATEIGPYCARVMTAGFLVMIVALPVLQGVIERAGQGTIQALDVFRRIPTTASLDEFEKGLNKQSFVQRVVQPWLQSYRSRDLGFGTTNVILGRDGWLFYRPGIDWLTGRGLLDSSRLALRTKELIEAGEATPAPDPRPAIRALDECCRKAGVYLVVMPVPDKAMLQLA